MIAITLFYVLFLILLILLIFIVLLYSGYHSRTLAPPLLDTFYGINAASGTSIPGNNTGTVPLYLTDGEGIYPSGVSGSLDFGASGITHQEFSFRPMWDDSQRKLRGNITLLLSRLNEDTPNLELELLDEGDSKVVADRSSFYIQQYDEGLTSIKLFFTSNELTGNHHHRFVLRGRGTSGTSITANEILLNSAYMYYY